MFSGTNGHIIAGGARQCLTQTSHCERLPVQAFVGPPRASPPIPREFILIVPIIDEDGAVCEGPPKMAIGRRNPKGVSRQAVKIFYFMQALARALCRSSHPNQ